MKQDEHPMNDDRQNQNEEPDAPARFAAALNRLQERRRIIIPSSVDDAILAQARQHLRQLPEARQPQGRAKLWERIRSTLALNRFIRLKLAPWAVAAATLVLMIWLVPYNTFRRAGTGPEDVNQDGQVDILDAFALARQLKQGERPQQQLDLNGDGVIDERDVSAIAAHAVSLDRRRNSP
jgi:hypothetical protein